MIKRHISFYANDFKPLNYCGEVIGYEAEVRTYELPFEIEPTTGEHDFNKCEGCQKNLKTIAKNFTVKYNGNGQKKGFPFCCSYHSNLVKIKEFNRVDFLNVPEMAARKIIYTNQHIRNNHNSENWYRVITDYIDIVFQSFGQMPSGCGEPLFLGNYLNSIAHSVKENKDIQPEKRNRISEFLNAYNTPVKEQKTDLNILLSIYEKWYKIFPFELTSYFGNLKQYFEKRFPILDGKPEVNIYSGIAKIKMHTKSSLIEALISLTDSLLTQINGVTLYEKGLITDTNKIKLELLINSRKLKLKQGYKNSSASEEQRYRKILKEWFNDEKKFIDEITPLLIAGTPQPTLKAETKKENQDFDKTLSEIKNSENKFWKGLPMEQVIKHFEVMTKRENKNGNVFLTNEQLISFLKRGFLNDTTQPKQKVNCSNGEKGFVIKRFYDFFDLAVSKYSYPQRKIKFIKLFTDCFDNWGQKTVEPFFKRNKTKDNW